MLIIIIAVTGSSQHIPRTSDGCDVGGRYMARTMTASSRSTRFTHSRGGSRQKRVDTEEAHTGPRHQSPVAVPNDRRAVELSSTRPTGNYSAAHMSDRRRDDEWVRVGPEPINLGPSRPWPTIIAITTVVVIALIALYLLA